jgi:hypothetical protein
MYLLDSNVVSELRSERRCDQRVRDWQATKEPEACYLSVLVLTEIRQGIEMVRARDRAFAEALDAWLERQVKPGFRQRCLPITPLIAERAGQIAAFRTRGLADCLIAATALVHQLTLATRNTSDFADIDGLLLTNPWEQAHPG